jgi:hypothetical protein
MSEREAVAQKAPSRPLAGFPAYRLRPDREVFRAHPARLGPWWFGSEGGGRFDLAPPCGTCYVAGDPASAVRERLGPVLGASDAVPEGLLADVVVSRLRVPREREVADVRDRRAAEFGVTRELESMVPYVVPQAWAVALADEGYGGVRYGPRFTPGEADAFALFDDGGAKDWSGDAQPVPAALVPGGPTTIPAPRRRDLNVVRPPRTRVARG